MPNAILEAAKPVKDHHWQALKLACRELMNSDNVSVQLHAKMLDKVLDVYYIHRNNPTLKKEIWVSVKMELNNLLSFI